MSCRYNNYIERHTDDSADPASLDADTSCALDLADKGPQTFKTISRALGCSPAAASELSNSALTSFIKGFGGYEAAREALEAIFEAP